MERNIPHVLDVFSCSPRARRRVHATDIDTIAVQIKDVDVGQKNPGSDSAVSVGSSDDETNISKYFDYLNDDDQGNGSASKRKKKKKTSGKENVGKENKNKDPKGRGGGEQQQQQQQQPPPAPAPSEHTSRRTEYEKDMKHIERHLSMKKTIRKKMMRDLQQAFVEDPGEFQQDPSRMAPDKKNNIDIRNLTFSKGRLSKSEHNFLDMLKDESTEKDKKDRKGFLGFNNNKNKGSKDNLKDDDSGHGSPSRDSPLKAKSKPDIREVKDTPPKEEKKIGFWKKLTGKGKNKR